MMIAAFPVGVLLTTRCLADKNARKLFLIQKPVGKHRLLPEYESLAQSMGEKSQPKDKAPVSRKQPQDHTVPKQGDKSHKGVPNHKPSTRGERSPTDAPKKPLKHERQPMLPGRKKAPPAQKHPVAAEKPVKSKQSPKHTTAAPAGKSEDHTKHSPSKAQSKDGNKPSSTKRSPARKNPPTPLLKSPSRCRMG